MVRIQRIDSSDALWEEAAAYARNCAWRAGRSLAEKMETNAFSGWERVFLAIKEGKIIGFCTLTRADSVPNVSYTPFIGYLFVDEKERGHRVGEALLRAAECYAHTLGFEKIYLVTDHDGLYEKFGYALFDHQPTHKGRIEKIYRKKIGPKN